MGEGKNRQKGSLVIAEAEAAPTIEKMLYRDLTVGAATGDPQNVRVGPLTLDGTLGLAHLIARAALKMDGAQIGQLRKAAGVGKDDKGEANKADIMAALAILDTETVAGVYGCFIGRKAEWSAKNFNLPEFLRVIDAVGEFNDPEEIMALFRGVARRWQPRSKN